MNKISKIIIGIMSGIIVILIGVIVMLSIKLKASNNNTSNNNNNINNQAINNASGIYYSENYRNYRNSTLKLNKDMSCEYPNDSVNCKWSISDDEVVLTLTKYVIVDDAKYTDDYYYNRYGIKDKSKVLNLGSSKESCEKQLELEQDELKNAKCELVSTKEQKITLVNGGVLFDNHRFNKIK
jgi:hypothetical protein